MAMSNDLCTTLLNSAFSLGSMAKEKDTPMKLIINWSSTKTRAALAKELEISPQALNNWIDRGIPPREHARVAALYGRSVEVLLGLAQDDPDLSELMTFWNVLLPQSKAEVVKHAKYIRTIQNPVPDLKPVKR